MKPARIEPGPGQESVWDYPRPPRLEPVPERLRVVFNDLTIADTTAAFRTLETSHPPTYYLPPADIRMDTLSRNQRRSICEWKGQARYFDLVVGQRRVIDVGWAYPNPVPAFERIRDYVAFYAHLVDACYVGDEPVQPQEGDFYGGWITSRVVGPFKGPTGTWFW